MRARGGTQVPFTGANRPVARGEDVVGQGGPAELEAATRADWDKMSPFENGGYLYKGMYSRNVLGSHAFGACVGSAHVACLYYTLFADPVQRTAEEYHWCAHPTRSDLT